MPISCGLVIPCCSTLSQLPEGPSFMIYYQKRMRGMIPLKASLRSLLKSP